MSDSNRELILQSIKSTCENIIEGSNGFNNTVTQVFRRMVTYDDSSLTFPVLMVLGGGEVFEDQFDPKTISKLRVKIRGYTKDEHDPETALNGLIKDVMQVLESKEYNPYYKSYKPISLDTDEGWLSTEMNGLGLFELTIEILYRFSRSDP
jgi:hypothetical protein